MTFFITPRWIARRALFWNGCVAVVARGCGANRGK